MRSTAFAQQVLLVALLALLGVFLVVPVWLTVRGGFVEDPVSGDGFTLRHVALVFRDPVLREGLMNALGLAVVSTTLSVLIGAPLAMVSVRYAFPFRKLWNAAVLVPLIMPPFVGAIGLKALLGRYGALNTALDTEWDILGAAPFWGVAIALALHLYPIIYLNVTATLANIDPALDEAAAITGAPLRQRMLRILLPLIRPGLFAGGAIVFIWSFTELGTPLIFDYYAITSVQIFRGIKEINASAQPYALTAVMLMLSVLFYAVGKLALGKAGHATTGRAARAAEDKRLNPAGAALATLVFAAVTALALLPHLGVILVAFSEPGSWYRSVLPAEFTLENFSKAFGHPLAFGSMANSFKLSLAAAFLDIAIGIVVAYLIVRTKVRGRSILDAMVMAPLAVPGLVLAFGYVAMSLNWPFREGDPLGFMNISILGENPNPFPLLILAYAVRRLPYVVRAAVSGLEQVHVELEEAAKIFNAGTARIFARIIVPLISANLIAGGLLAFSFAMLEVSDSLILAQQERHYPLTKAIYTFSFRLGDGLNIASALGVWGMALLAATLVGTSILMGKRLGAVFRA
ncbi:MAG: ABC transporter permease [Phycisphaerales bacterium]